MKLFQSVRSNDEELSIAPPRSRSIRPARGCSVLKLHDCWNVCSAIHAFSSRKSAADLIAATAECR